MNEYPLGLYDLLYTEHLHERLAALGLLDQADLEKLEVSELPRYLAVPLAREIATCVKVVVEGCKREVATVFHYLNVVESIPIPSFRWYPVGC